MPKLGRRKYQELVRFWKATISNPRVSHRVRMSAAQRLDDLYRRHEFYEQQAIARKDRAEARALSQQGQEGAVPLQESASVMQETDAVSSEDERIASVFNNILNGKGSSVHDAE
jgi:hypothetical protein